MKTAHILDQNALDIQTAHTISLTYQDRMLRRRKLTTDQGWDFVLDLEQTTSLDDGDYIICTDGTAIQVLAKPETLAKISGDHLPVLAWHIGNRHTPCQVEFDYLLIQHDHVIEHMIVHLGGQVEHVTAPFVPLGGAYGHGRTQSHDHGATTHVHSH